jgi:hypothetical protein
MPTSSEDVRSSGETGSGSPTVKTTRLTHFGVRQESWQRIGGEPHAAAEFHHVDGGFMLA